MDENDGVFLCWENESDFLGFVFISQHQKISDMRMEIDSYEIISHQFDYVFLYKHAPVSMLQESILEAKVCVESFSEKPTIFVRRMY